ncbi:MAG: acetyl-CoA C-acyltransferase [Aureispira sp.]
MNNKKQAIYLIGALRSPIGKLHGALAHWRPDDLAAAVLKELLQQATVDPSLIDGIVLGCANQAGEDNRNIARMVALLAGLDYSSTALTVNSLCSSSLEATLMGLRQIALGEGDCYVVGGVESMSRSPWVISKIDQSKVDSMIGWRFVNPKLAPMSLSMAQTAELLAEAYNISRTAQDKYAQQSRLRYQAALEQNIWAQEIAPLTISSASYCKDEQHRVLSSALLAKMPPIVKGGQYITAGNAARVGDGAALLLLASERFVQQQQLRPLAKITHWASAACHPNQMSYAAVAASKKLLHQAQLSAQSLDWVEYSESFALQVLLGIKELGLSPEIVNPHGGALSIGNPIAAGAIRTVVSLANQMQRSSDLRYGLATTAGGLGTGAAVLLEQA